MFFCDIDPTGFALVQNYLHEEDYRVSLLLAKLLARSSGEAEDYNHVRATGASELETHHRRSALPFVNSVCGRGPVLSACCHPAFCVLGA